jgi:hypothetical protein
MKADVEQICGEIPDWLASVDASSMETDFFPLTQMLSGSVYYPACRFDGGPIANLGYQYQSYVYVDYGCGRAELHKNLAEHPFSGYQMVGRQEVRIEELTPAGWGLPYLTPRELEQCQAQTRYDKTGRASFCDWLIFDREPLLHVRPLLQCRTLLTSSWPCLRGAGHLQLAVTINPSATMTAPSNRRSQSCRSLNQVSERMLAMTMPPFVYVTTSAEGSVRIA